MRKTRHIGLLANRSMKNIPKIPPLLCLIIATQLLSACFVSQPFTPEDKLNKKQLKKLPESEIVLVAKTVGTQTGSQLCFRKDSIFTLQTQTAFGWEQFNGNYTRIESSDTFSFVYFNDHKARWKYIVIDEDKALLKVELNDSTPKQLKIVQIVKNVMTK